MRIVIALGGNALLRRGEALTAENQRHNVRIAARALAPLTSEHELVVTHGNGPQVGLLALQGAAYEPAEAFPLDVLGAQTEGMIGYLIEQELANLLPAEVPLASLLTRVEVDPGDPAFEQPTKFVGPVYAKSEADRLAREKGWVFARDGDAWRRVVPSPDPQRIIELRPIRWLLEREAVVICAGGGGIPTVVDPGPEPSRAGVEAVIDKDLCSGLLARELDADLLVMATDVDAVHDDWETPHARAIFQAAPGALASRSYAAGSMGPKVRAAREFADRPGRLAAIGSLAELPGIVRGERGTQVGMRFEDVVYHP